MVLPQTETIMISVVNDIYIGGNDTPNMAQDLLLSHQPAQYATELPFCLFLKVI